MTIQSLNKLYNWQGATPPDWVLKPMRYCVALRQNGDWGDEPDDEEGIYCLRAADFDYDMLGLKDEKSFTKRKYSSARFNKVKLKPGDLLVEKSGGGEKVPVGRAILFYGHFEACFSNFLERICVLPNISPRFFFYWWTAGYQSLAFVPYFNQTTGIQNLDSSELLSRCSIALPLLDEQERISDVIDAQCSLINKSIATLSKEVDILKHYRASVIHEAVTKGLNSDAPMKSSGIDWISGIPERWKLNKLKYADHFISDSLQENTSPDFKFRYVDIGSVAYGIGIKNYTEMNFGDSPSRARKRVANGDTIVSTVRTYLKAIAMITDDDDLIVSTGFSVIRPYMHLPKYLYYLCCSEWFCQQVEKYAWGIAYPAIGEKLLGRIWVPVPPMDVQEDIVSYLDNQTSAIDEVLETKRRQIEVLKRRRQSLIYEYVTGKRRVGKEI